MKILQWSASPASDRGGRAAFVKDLADQLTELGHEIIWAITLEASSGHSVRSQDNSLILPSHERVSALQQKDFALYSAELQKFLHSHRPDIIHCHKIGSIESLILSAAATALKIPILYTEHEAPTMGADEFFAKRNTILQRVSTVICPSEHSKSLMRKIFPSLAERFVSIPNGVPEPGSSVTNLVPQSVYFSGRHSPEKGARWLLESWRLVLDSEPDAQLTIAGEGIETQDLLALAEQLGVASSIRWPGWLERGANLALMNSHQVVVVPSLWEEPFGLVAAEASAAGRPVIVSAVGALSNVVADGVTGIHVTPRDNNALASAILRLLHNPQEGEDMGQAGRERAFKIFSIQACANLHINLYSTTIRESQE